MPKAMILSVGTGTRAETDIVKPLVKTVRDSAPALVFFLVSSESQKHGEEVARQLNLASDQFQCVPVHSPDDVEQSFVTALEALRKIRSKGYRPEDIVADYTSGTKAMTAGLALAAVALRCGTLKYIFGVRREGVVVDGTEKFLSIPPAGILAASEIELAQRFIIQMRFEAAGEILSGTNDTLLTEYDKGLKNNIQLLASAYSRWDHFDHRQFCGEYGKVEWGKPELEPFRLKSALPHTRLIPIANALGNGKITPDTLADLWNNAERRAREGRFDDAVARLYRLTEMLAQHILKSQHDGIDTSNIDLTNKHLATLGPSVHEHLEQRREPSDGRIKIGLKEAYWLLGKLGNRLGQIFESNSKLSGLLKDRNESILAHGTKPVTREIYQSLSQQVLPLLKEVDKEFDSRSRDLQFPWLVSAIQRQ